MNCKSAHRSKYSTIQLRYVQETQKNQCSRLFEVPAEVLSNRIASATQEALDPGLKVAQNAILVMLGRLGIVKRVSNSERILKTAARIILRSFFQVERSCCPSYGLYQQFPYLVLLEATKNVIKIRDLKGVLSEQQPISLYHKVVQMNAPSFHPTIVAIAHRLEDSKTL